MKKSDRLYTYADYCRWPEGERWELINGTAYDMSPAPNRRHQEIAGEVFRRLSNFVQNSPCQAYIAPFDVRLSEQQNAADNEITNVVQPDISVFCSPEALDEAGAIGPPDIAVEVLSPYTSVKDQREKLALYEDFQVKEYWIIDPANFTIAMYSIESGSGTEYGKPELLGPGDQLHSRVLNGFTLDLAELFAD